MKTHSRFKGIKYIDLNSYLESEPLLILMHPFYDEKAMSKSYIGNLREVISEYDGPILTMEDEISFKDTFNFVKDLYPLSARFFVKTNCADIKLKSVSKSSFYTFLKEHTFDNKLGLMGGYYNNNDKSHYESGCLGSLDFELQQKGFETFIVEGCIYSHK